MSLTYGFLKCKIVGMQTLKPSQLKHEVQYHVHASLQIGDADGASQLWDSATNVGTSNPNDLLKYRLVATYRHALLDTLKAATPGFTDLTASRALPALDFLRSDPLAGTGTWQLSDVMDGEETRQPVASLLQLLESAQQSAADVYFFGRTYTGGDLGIHDVHMNQGSQGPQFRNDGNDANDHNDIWQDGAVLVDFGNPQWSAYFTAFTQQLVPTDDLGNPTVAAHPISDTDPGSLQP